MPFTSSEPLPLVVESNQNNEQKILSKEIPKDLDQEAVKVLEETPKVREKKAPDELKENAPAPAACPRPVYPVAAPPAPPPASRPPRR